MPDSHRARQCRACCGADGSSPLYTLFNWSADGEGASGEEAPRCQGTTNVARPSPRGAVRDEVVHVAPAVMTAEDAVEIVGWLSASDVDVWLLGGWGVDALVGEQTRDHKDLDLMVRDEHVSRMSDVLNEHGFRLERGVQGGFGFRDETRGTKTRKLVSSSVCSSRRVAGRRRTRGRSARLRGSSPGERRSVIVRSPPRKRGCRISLPRYTRGDARPGNERQSTGPSKHLRGWLRFDGAPIWMQLGLRVPHDDEHSVG
jgi:Aminoglycoside-2''-adenylyltransferase